MEYWNGKEKSTFKKSRQKLLKVCALCLIALLFITYLKNLMQTFLPFAIVLSEKLFIDNAVEGMCSNVCRDSSIIYHLP